MLRFVIDSARAAGIEISLCGEMAADPGFALLLVGLGLRRLSMSPRQIPEVKTWVREATVAELAELAARCLEHSTAAEVQAHLEGFLAGLSPSKASASGV
jgi:phosphotransferase system enzyme I (PtsI)